MLTLVTGLAGCILTTAQLPLGVLRRKLRRDHRKYLATATAAVLVEFWVTKKHGILAGLLAGAFHFVGSRLVIPAVTGGIGSGKSTAVACLEAKYNVQVIDADKIAREIMEPGRCAFKEVVASFGEGIVTPQGQINRQKLGELVFGDAEARALLERITHKYITMTMLWRLFSYRVLPPYNKPPMVLDVPLLLETPGLSWICDPVVVVYVDPQTQLDRLVKRCPTESVTNLTNRVKSQMSLEDKMALADRVIDNRGDLKSLEKQVDALYEGEIKNM
ncbi:dephospho-CoA kinase, putative [Perkinsus marinus ATCC 50983]|uniref:Dephospho-CoA kinase, putative n=1 Tax=Perkinsus marinus (strain ATCC 50983 / TXsc) TaxID=423536 RepID=C5LVA3_PERM5|nr:dephospho-CoA kinase, putative [Perkinsus marinus ATCC 50983]EEQ99341.1 dephospho-CoA kinase, putative [Perkinsus marinus ATCC 50983]|eukprot:XP_002766624.1 dephospho-CoA kinase, putative [Perkinsus marinus ATCC 50983]